MWIQFTTEFTYYLMTISSSMLVSPTIKQENTVFGSSLITNVCLHLLMLVLKITEKTQMFKYV